MFNWHSNTLELLNIGVILLTTLVVIKDVRLLNNRFYRRIGVGAG